MLPKNLLCFSPIRWDYIMHRPQQLLMRFAEGANVYFFEEPLFDAIGDPYLTYGTLSETLWKIVPHLAANSTSWQVTSCLTALLDGFLENANLDRWAFWYYSTIPLPFTEKYIPRLIIFDQLEEQESLSGWDSIFLSVHQQIINRLPEADVIAILP